MQTSMEASIQHMTQRMDQMLSLFSMFARFIPTAPGLPTYTMDAPPPALNPKAAMAATGPSPHHLLTSAYMQVDDPENPLRSPVTPTLGPCPHPPAITPNLPLALSHLPARQPSTLGFC